MARLIGREAERKKLDRFYQSPKAEFLAIYGRRRIEKTFLIQDFYTKKKEAVCFHTTGLKEGSLRDKIKSFTQVIGKTFYNGAELQSKAKWMDVFEQLTEAINKLPKNKKVILFFDEFTHITPIRKALHIPTGAEIGSWRYIPRKEKFQDQGCSN